MQPTTRRLQLRSWGYLNLMVYSQTTQLMHVPATSGAAAPFSTEFRRIDSGLGGGDDVTRISDDRACGAAPDASAGEWMGGGRPLCEVGRARDGLGMADGDVEKGDDDTGRWEVDDASPVHKRRIGMK
ncbi:hypothetical protein CCMA1212_007212 [Trichoderma ghanense]|uniref:Uncharacterized protein n=1 Tax=Trichoderma ghanense TaxID=65468 RepID=A0ABY2GXI0_9HYPO